MDHKPVESSHIASAGHDADSELMEVTFHNGRTYRYEGVSGLEYQGFLEAPSKGKYLATRVKPKYLARIT